MAWPSWFEQASRPSTWVDWSASFRKTIPREWPRGLFGADSEARKDTLVIAEALAMARDMLEQAMRYIWPAEDTTDGIFMARWEAVFKLGSGSSSLTQRAYNLLSAMRQRGTLTVEKTKAAMLTAFGTDDPSELTLVTPTMANIISAFSGVDLTDPVSLKQLIKAINSLHIHHTAETTEPNQALLQNIASRIKPTWEHWTGGRYEHLIWGTPGEEGAWDEAVWG